MAGRAAQAKEIYQNLLDGIVQCYFDRDFQSFRNFIHVPHHFRTATDTFVLRDVNALENMFHRYIDHCEDAGLTDYKRFCLSAKFRTPDRIEGTHESHLMCGTEPMCPVFRSTSILMRMHGSWMVCASDSHLKKESAQGTALREALKASTTKPSDNLTMPPRPLE